MTASKEDFTDFENFLLRKIDQLFKKIDKLSERITRVEERLSTKWSGKQWAAVICAFIIAAGGVFAAFVR